MFPFNFVTSEPIEQPYSALPATRCRLYSHEALAGGMLDNATLAFKYLLQFPDVVPLVGIEKTWEIE